MKPPPKPVASLITAHRIEPVRADLPSAINRATRAEEKLEAARRIAVTAHMLARGYRVRAIAGAHEAVGIYAEAMISAASVREFQRMRRRRNKSEYGDTVIGRADLTTDIGHAAAIIQAIGEDLQ